MAQKWLLRGKGIVNEFTISTYVVLRVSLYPTHNANGYSVIEFCLFSGFADTTTAKKMQEKGVQQERN